MVCHRPRLSTSLLSLHVLQWILHISKIGPAAAFLLSPHIGVPSLNVRRCTLSSVIDHRHSRSHGSNTRAAVASAFCQVGRSRSGLEGSYEKNQASPTALSAASFSMGGGRLERGGSVGTAQKPTTTAVQEASSPSSRGAVWGLVLPEARQPRRPPLPRLTDGEQMRLLLGERIEKQERIGRVGTGIVAVDVEADISVVMAVLTDLDRYVLRIPTMRDVRIFRQGNQVVSAQFCLSRFRLEINTDMKVDLERNMFEFRLDPTRPTMALQEARGFWYVEKAEGRPEGWSRVWLKAMVKCDPLLPNFIVDYAASQALPRASGWLQPVMKEVAQAVKEQGLRNVHEVASSYVEIDKLKSKFEGLEHPMWNPKRS